MIVVSVDGCELVDEELPSPTTLALCRTEPNLAVVLVISSKLKNSQPSILIPSPTVRSYFSQSDGSFPSCTLPSTYLWTLLQSCLPYLTNF